MKLLYRRHTDKAVHRRSPVSTMTSKPNTTSTTKSKPPLPPSSGGKRIFFLSQAVPCPKANAPLPNSGNLSNKSLTTIVAPSFLIRDSDYLETHLVAVPNPLTKDFLKTYETLSPMTVPRSGTRIAQDDEFTLYTVTTFKKHSQQFVHRCRESKWTPRDFKFQEGGREEEQKELEKVGREERKVWGEALRLGRTAWGEAVMAWIHVLALRVFVETVLRYGLPLDFVCGIVMVCSFFLLLMASSGLRLSRKKLTDVENNRLHPNL